jgi:beta-lactamase class A
MLTITRSVRPRLSRRRLVASGLAAAAPARARGVRAQAGPAASPLTTPAVGESPVARQFAWVLDELNSGAVGVTEDIVTERFAADFLAAVPVAVLIAGFREVSAQGPFTVDSYVEAPDALTAEAVLGPASGEALRLSLAVEPDPPHRIAGLFVQAAVTATPEPLASWDELDQRWSALAPAVNFLAAEVVDGECVPVHALNSDKRLAIGSTFKLYILGELADQVRDGTVAWDEPLAIRDDWKASFSGPMSALDAGDERTLREFAEQMISVSDNTATDHLLFLLGRENVEAIQAEMGHGAPEANQPMFSTQEMFQIKLAAPEELLQEYREASVAERRRLLDTEIAALTVRPEAAARWTEPILIEDFEWFASAEELCQAMATLDAWSGEPGLEPITEILSINPGVPFDPAAWEYIGFKGGSETGVLNLTWLLRHVNGRTYVMTSTLNDTEAAIDDPAAIAALQAAAQLLAASAE